MVKNSLKKILTLNGISILFGIIGGVMGVLSIFVDWNLKISIKWLAALVIVFSFLLLISLLLSYELYKSHKRKFNLNFQVLKFSTEHSLLLVENNENLEFSQTVSIYYELNKFEILMALGFVENITGDFTQIKITRFDEDFISNHRNEYEKLLNSNKESLDSVLIKNYYRYAE